MKTRLISLNRPKWLNNAEKKQGKHITARVNSGVTNSHRIVREG